MHRIREYWYRVVRDHAPLHKVDGRCVLIGDGVKQPKEARRMPEVKRMHQESGNSSKAEYIFGGLGILIGRAGCFACLPLSLLLHDGLREAADRAGGQAISAASHVVQMIQNACDAALVFGNSLLLLDRYFLSVAGLERLAALNASRSVRVDIVTRAKMNCVAYEEPGPGKPGPGRPPKKGASVHLRKLFESQSAAFTSAEVELYGKKEEAQWLCLDLLWGTKLYQKLRFVLVKRNNDRGIFVSTDLTLDPVQIVQLYSRRFSIETCFRELKQQTGAFCYRFRTRHLPELSHFPKKNDASPPGQVNDEQGRRKILKTVQAIGMHMMISCIAMGTLQILTIELNGKVSPAGIRYLRTPSKGRMSEATLMDWMRRKLFMLLSRRPESVLTRLILRAQDGTREDTAA